jgi:hypothetical protein
VLYTDADMPVDLAALEAAIELLGTPGTGMVVGRRRSYDEARLRTVASKAYDRVARTVLGVAEPDVNFPFKLVARETARRLELRSEGALVDVELVARIHQLGLGVEHLVLDYRQRQFGASKTMTLRLLRQLALELVRNRRSIKRGASSP